MMFKNIEFKLYDKKDTPLIIGVIILIVVYILSPKALVITSGRYAQGNEEENKLVDSILGEEYAEERFELYFQWYNVVHEIGHGIVWSNNNTKLEVSDEEQLVNDFAVAFWRYYGEEEKIKELENTVTYALKNIKCPVDDNVSHLEYGREKWGKKEFFTFNNYGWFQFSCVNSALNKDKTLEEVLSEMGVKDVKIQPKKTLIYEKIDEETSTKIVNDVASIVREWGAELPNVYHKYSNDPNKNMIQNLKNVFWILDLLYK